MRSTNASGQVNGSSLGGDFDAMELDPSGKSLGFDDPYAYGVPAPEAGFVEPFESFGAMINGQFTTFTVDGVQVPRKHFDQMTEFAFQGFFGALERQARMSAKIGEIWRTVTTPNGPDGPDGTIRIGNTDRYKIADVYDASFSWAVIGLISGQVDPFKRIPLVQKLRSKDKLSQTACDKYLNEIFGNATSTVATKNEPIGVGQKRKYKKFPGADYEAHLGAKGVFHMYANADGSAANTRLGEGKMYIPNGGSLINPTTGEYAEDEADPGPPTRFSNEFIFNYAGGLTIKVFHVGGTKGNGKDHGGNILQPDMKDKNKYGYRIGYIGGLGGESGDDDYEHSHWEFNVRGKRVDPRKLFCNW